MVSPDVLDDLGFGVQQLNELLDALDLLARLPLRRRIHLADLDSRRDVDPELGDRDLLQLLLSRLHDPGQRRVAWLVQPEVGGDDTGKREAHGLEPTVYLARHFGRLLV